jgi:ArsR family transcriptional regulator, arsenate/arsenite/antimonite-responsive transcriptional repressor
METYLNHRPGMWSIGRSIILELETALTFALDKQRLPGLSSDIAEVVEAIPEDWRLAWNDLWGKAENYRFGLENVARIARTIEEEDYGQATLPVRELTLEAALARLTAQASDLGLVIDSRFTPVEKLVDLGTQKQAKLFSGLGFHLGPDDERAQSTRRELACAARILADGDLHTRFWLLVDRFFYEIYRPWREARLSVMDQLEMRARTALGKPDQIPDLEWLPARNPLLRQPELRQTVESGLLHVFFWVEPFGLPDTWLLEPGYIAASFAEGGIIFQNFQAWAQDVSGRAQALADPTRLIILRMIRHFGMVNTEIAEYLGISRPTVSVHAKILREAGLIDSHSEGRLVRHEINSKEIRRLFQDLETFLDLPPEG